MLDFLHIRRLGRIFHCFIFNNKHQKNMFVKLFCLFGLFGLFRLFRKKSKYWEGKKRTGKTTLRWQDKINGKTKGQDITNSKLKTNFVSRKPKKNLIMVEGLRQE